MKRRLLHGIGIFLFGFGVVAACGNDQSRFETSSQGFGNDAGVLDAPSCAFQCSLDGRAVLDSCTGNVVHTCDPDQACGGALCQEPCAAAAADKSSNGCEFYFQMPRYSANFVESCYATFVVNASLAPVTLTLDRAGTPLDLSKSVFQTKPGDTTLLPLTGPLPPGESAIVFIADRPQDGGPAPIGNYIACPDGVVPASYVDIPGNSRTNTAFHLKTSAPTGAVAMYPFGGAASFIPSATLLFPTATWGNEHVIVNGWESNEPGDPAAAILASEDGTDVTIDPVVDIQNGEGVVGTAAHVPVTYHLNKGELVQLVQREELSGSTVTSTKPTSVFGGHGCSFIPSDGSACDVLNQQLPPFEQWGNEYVGVGYRPRLGSEHEPMYYRIVGARDGTQLDYDPALPAGAPVTLSAGEVATFMAGTGDAFVVRSQDANHAFYLGAYMTGSALYGGRGDPEFVNVVASGQYLSKYSFYADATYKESSITIVRTKDASGQLKDVWLDCAGGNLTSWTPVGTRGQYEFTRVDLAKNGGPGDTFGTNVCKNGLQGLHSDGPFTATIWGWDFCASYAYPGAMAQRKLVDSPLVAPH